MVASGSNKLCAKCNKIIKSTEIVLVCGLWCKKSFHHQCLGLSITEARGVTCSKVRIKFHCDACEERLAIKLFGEDKTQEPGNLENRVSLLGLVLKLVKLTTKLSIDNSDINSKLDSVLSSNLRLEEYLSQSSKHFENRSEEALSSYVDYVESESTERITEIREQHDDTNSQNIHDNQLRWCATELQQTDNSLLHIASDFPEQSAGNQHPYQQQNIGEDCSPNIQVDCEEHDIRNSRQDPLTIIKEEWEEADGCSSRQNALSIVKEEFSPSEDSQVATTSSVEQMEDEEDEEWAVTEADTEKCPSSEDFLGPRTFSIENTEAEEVEEAVNNDGFQDVKREAESTFGSGEPESSVPTAVGEDKADDDRHNLVTNTSLLAKTHNRIRHNNIKQEAEACSNRINRKHLGHRCGICKKLFVQLHELKEHTQVHIRKDKLICSVCHKTFTSRKSLKLHFGLHTAERPYSCSICNKAFKQSKTNKQHLALHTGERPYSCSVCNKSFVANSHLKVHSRLLTGEFLYSCSICNKRFNTMSQLKQHSHSHSDERPYSCEVCCKTFKSVYYLNYHSKLHTGKTP